MVIKYTMASGFLKQPHNSKAVSGYVSPQYWRIFYLNIYVIFKFITDFYVLFPQLL